MRFVDLTGKRYGQLVVVGLGKRNKWNRITWKCRCDCGNFVEIPSGRLNYGGAKKCTSRDFHLRLPKGEPAFNVFYAFTRSNAKRRNLTFDISKEEAKIISQRNCFYCGRPPKNVAKTSNAASGVYVYSGFDRVNNSVGYTVENVVACCKTCNRAKDVMTIEDFRQWVKAVHKNWAGN